MPKLAQWNRSYCMMSFYSTGQADYHKKLNRKDAPHGIESLFHRAGRERKEKQQN